MTSLQVHVATIRGAAGPAADARATWHDEAPPTVREELRQLDIDLLQPGRYQPRRRFDGNAIAELAASIRAEGVLQPIVVRALPGTLPQRYEIIAGERRWRAAQLVGLAQIPAVVRTADDRAALVQALIENIQREDLNPVEEARGVQRLIDELGLTHEEAARRLGRSRDAISHLLRILKLDAGVLQKVETGAISFGHAKLLAGQPVAWQRFLAQQIATEGLTVRQLERRIRTVDTRSLDSRPRAPRDADVARLEQRVSELTGTTTQVEYAPGSHRGRIAFSFHSLEELQGLLERLGYTDV